MPFLREMSVPKCQMECVIGNSELVCVSVSLAVCVRARVGEQKRSDGNIRMGTRHESESNGVSVYLSVPNANANAQTDGAYWFAGTRHCRRDERKIMLCTHTIGACLFLYLSF